MPSSDILRTSEALCSFIGFLIINNWFIWCPNLQVCPWTTMDFWYLWGFLEWKTLRWQGITDSSCYILCLSYGQDDHSVLYSKCKLMKYLCCGFAKHCNLGLKYSTFFSLTFFPHSKMLLWLGIELFLPMVPNGLIGLWKPRKSWERGRAIQSPQLHCCHA